MKRRLKLSLLLATLTFGLLACAAKPTHLLVDPAVNAPASGIGSGIALQLNVSPDPSLSPLQENQSRFPLKRSVSEAVREKLSRELQAMGFRIEAGATRTLSVTLIKTEHTITRQSFKDEIAALSVIQLDAVNEFGSLTRRFSDNRQQEVGGSATLGEASGVMNLSIGHVLNRSLGDPELMQFLSRQY